MSKIISGIQQIGIGVSNLNEAWKWYRKYFGMDICIFEEHAVAEYMLHYTEGEPRARHAVLAMNIQGGGGFEVWQHTDKEPSIRNQKCSLGDIGINICKIKTVSIEKTFQFFTKSGLHILSDIIECPDKRKHFFVKDLWDNTFQFIEHSYMFHTSDHVNGGVLGAVIGVSDIEASLRLYSDILDYDVIQYDISGTFDDLKMLHGGERTFRRVLLKHSKQRKGPFSELLGPSEIELVSLVEDEANVIYDGRIWGDPGFIHICFDIVGFEALKEECKEKGFPFTVDSTEAIDKAFDMGAAAGNFSYVSDPDGTPIEFVETKKIPIIKKLGWYLDLHNRNPEKPIPRWMLKALRFQRRK